MEGQNKQVLKLLLKKIASSDLLLLSEAAEKLGVSESYLNNLIRTGKLKGFKVDSHWFIEENWLNELKADLKSRLHQEIKSSGIIKNHSAKWSRLIKKRSIEVNVWGEISRLAWSSAGLGLASVLLVVFFLPVMSFSQHKQEAADYALRGVDAVYSTPLALIEATKLSFFSHKINDEVITKFLQRIIRPPKFNTVGQVAGEVEIADPGSWIPRKAFSK